MEQKIIQIIKETFSTEGKYNFNYTSYNDGEDMETVTLDGQYNLRVMINKLLELTKK